MRGQGRAFRQSWKDVNGRSRKSPFWSIDYSLHGRRYKEKTGLTKRKDAVALLRQRISDRDSGKLVGNPDSVTVHALRALMEKQYDLEARRSKDRLKQCWTHLEGFFGTEATVKTVTPVRLDDYAAARLNEKASRQTVNHELSALRRGFSLAIDKGMLAVMPRFDLPDVPNARSGFFEEGEFAALLLELPADVRDVVQFLRATGWRRDEARLLTWSAVDREGGTIRLEGARTKSGNPRVFPFGLAASLSALIEARWSAREGLYVFHRDGKAILRSSIRAAWKRACLRTGLAVKDPVTKRVKLLRIVHDLRRSAARDFRRAGVSEGVIMDLCGWKTRAMFDRYNIIDEADLAAAVAKRFGNGRVKAESEGTPAVAVPLNSFPSNT